MCSVVGAIVSVQYNAFFYPAIRDGGDNGSYARPARVEAEEGGFAGQASGGFHSRNCDRRIGAVGGPRLRRWLI